MKKLWKAAQSLKIGQRVTNEQQTAQSVKPFSAQTCVNDEILVKFGNFDAMRKERLQRGMSDPTPLMMLTAEDLHEKLREHIPGVGRAIDMLADSDYWISNEGVLWADFKLSGWETEIAPEDILRPETEQEGMDLEHGDDYEEVAPITIRRMLRHVLEKMVGTDSSEEDSKAVAYLLAKLVLPIASLHAWATDGMMTATIIGRAAHAGEYTFTIREEKTGRSHILRPLSGEQEMFCQDRMGRRVTLFPVETDYDLNEISAWWITPAADVDEKNGEETPKEETSESADTDTLKFTPQGRAHEMPGIVFKAIDLSTSAPILIRPKDDVQERMLTLYDDLEMTATGIHVDDDGVWECETLAA